MTCLLNNSIIPASAEVPDACKQQAGGDVDCTLHLSTDKSHTCNDDFRK